jgi:hypothetical protein
MRARSGIERLATIRGDCRLAPLSADKLACGVAEAVLFRFGARDLAAETTTDPLLF